MKFIEFMASGMGRAVRMLAGLALLVIGVYLLTGPSVVAGLLVGAIGLVPLFAGLFDICVFAPLFGAPFHGTHIRQRARTS